MLTYKPLLLLFELTSFCHSATLSAMQSVSVGSWTNDSLSYISLCAHGLKAQTTSSAGGQKPYWNKHFTVSMSMEQLEDSYLSKHGVCLYLFTSEAGKKEDLLGQRFVLYKHLMPENGVDACNCEITSSRGGILSDTCAKDMEMNHEIIFHIEIIGHADIPFSPCTNNVRVPRLKLQYIDASGCDRGCVDSILRTKPNDKIQQTKFDFHAKDGGWWARYIRIQVKDDIKKGDEAIIGYVYVPIKNFAYSSRGEKNTQIYYIVHPKFGSIDNTSDSGLGSITINTTLTFRIKKFEPLGPPLVTLQTQLQPSNEYCTAYVGDVISSANAKRCNANELSERFLVHAAPQGLTLEADALMSISATQTQLSLSHQFHRFFNDADKNTISERRLEVRLFENQKRSLLPPYEWGRGHLLPSDRSEFSDETGTISCSYNPYDSTAVPYDTPGFEWDGEWKHDLTYTTCDAEGWSYGLDFGKISLTVHVFIC